MKKIINLSNLLLILGLIFLFSSLIVYIFFIKNDVKIIDKNKVLIRVPYKNEAVEYCLRVPTNFSAEKGKKYRVIIFMEALNYTAEKAYDTILKKNHLGDGRYLQSINQVLDEFDKSNIFVLFTPSNLPAFYAPESGTGELLLNALKIIKEKYPINEKSLIYVGESAGGVAAASFASWKPKICSGWVAYGASFDDPIKKAAKTIPFFIGCGQKDKRAYKVLRKITDNSDGINSNGIFKYYRDRGHCPDVNAYQLMFSCVFYFHYFNEQNLNKKHVNLPVEFVGDARSSIFYSLKDDRIKAIPEKDKVNLPNIDIANFWGIKSKNSN